MNGQKVPQRYNLMKITIWCALFAPLFFEIFNACTGFVLVKHGVMERWPIFAYMTIPFIAGAIIQKLQHIRPDILTRIFLMMCWVLAFFVSSLFWESLLRQTPQGIQAVRMLVMYPTLITGICFAFGLSIRATNLFQTQTK
ncbi:MAG: hypothetical protein K9M36_01195 [Candidatus Pacebacteria bacterium]|nr:hypothetical protein [Candidatus Paceibacterota bacterium]